MSDPVREALSGFPLLGTDPSGPLGRGLLVRGVLAESIRAMQGALVE